MTVVERIKKGDAIMKIDKEKLSAKTTKLAGNV